MMYLATLCFVVVAPKASKQEAKEVEVEISALG